MSYEPTQWKSGDIVTSAKLNKIEQGIAANGNNIVMGVFDDEGNLTLESTWQEIWDNNYTIIYAVNDEYKALYPIISLNAIDNSVTTVGPHEYKTLYANNANDYPSELNAGGDNQ